MEYCGKAETHDYQLYLAVNDTGNEIEISCIDYFVAALQDILGNLIGKHFRYSFAFDKNRTAKRFSLVYQANAAPQ